MRIYPILPLLIASLLAYFVLYSPQPLFPILSLELNLSETQTALLTTATMVPLFLAPLTFGRLLSSYSPEYLLRAGLLLLAITTLGFVMAENYAMLLIIRFMQGILLPVILTSVMTLTSRRAAPEELQGAMSFYVTATILGGLFGRLISGVFADFSDWRYFYYLMTAGLTLTAFFPFGQGSGFAGQDTPFNWPDVKVLVVECGLGWVFLAVSCLFFVFSAMMNFLPFRVGSLSEEVSSVFISLMYSGYLLGVVTSLLSARITLWSGGSLQTMLLGFLIYATAAGMTVMADIGVLFLSLFIFCGGMFLVHSVATAFVNKVAGEKRRVVNALYLTFYYLGGMLGSFVPGVIYEMWGWNYFIISLLFASAVGVASIFQLKIKN